jgi:hypothetical protein
MNLRLSFFIILVLSSFELMAMTSAKSPMSAVCVDDNSVAIKKQIVTDLVAKYQPNVVARYGTQVELKFEKSDDCSFVMAYAGHNKDEKIVLRIFPGTFQQLSQEANVFVVCHELGHLLGSITPKETGVSSKFDPRDSIEGEADYFGGDCARRALCPAESDNLCEPAVDAAREALEAIYGTAKPIDPDGAQHLVYKKHHGIDPEYPSPDCRLLSVIYGVLGKERPTCLYSPKTKKRWF